MCIVRQRRQPTPAQPPAPAAEGADDLALGTRQTGSARENTGGRAALKIRTPNTQQ